MRSTRVLALTAFAAAALAPACAAADDRLHLTPPLYREQAHAARMDHTIPTITPRPVPRAPGTIALWTAPAALAAAR